jgi:flagellar motor switch protein FliN/FliY
MTATPNPFGPLPTGQDAEPSAQELTERALQAAVAVAEALPSPEALTPGEPVTDLAAVPLPAASQAVYAGVTGAVRGQIAVVVDGSLVEALRSSPLGELELVPAVQSALQAAAGTLGPAAIGTAQQLETTLAMESLSRVGAAVGVPLLAGDTVGATLLLALEPQSAATPAPPPPAPPPAAVADKPGGPSPARGLELLRDVEMELTVELGRTRMAVRDVLELLPGTIVELDRAAGSPADVLLNGRLIARGEIVVIDEDFGVRITEFFGDAGAELRQAGGSTTSARTRQA